MFSKLHGVEMAWPGDSLEQTWLARELYGADMARHTPCRRYGMASTLPGAEMAGQETIWSRYVVARELNGANLERHTI